MSITNEDIKRFLVSEFGTEKSAGIVLFPEYPSAFTGISMDGKVIYDINKIGMSIAVSRHLHIANAMIAARNEVSLLCEAAGENAPVINMGSPFSDQ